MHVFGIRHHGPGCARSLRRALDELAPDVIVIEGPADAQDELSWATHVGMKPPEKVRCVRSWKPAGPMTCHRFHRPGYRTFIAS